jgi:hypothetical protein
MDWLYSVLVGSMMLEMAFLFWLLVLCVRGARSTRGAKFGCKEVAAAEEARDDPITTPELEPEN